MQHITNKRKFSDDQIKSLEFMFESESRPESSVKQQLANELGLQPRQVAVWFQNRRARLKAKQIELEYSKLKANFDTLDSSCESLKEENRSLLVQLQKLKSMLAKRQEKGKNWELDHNEVGKDVKCQEENTTESKEASIIINEHNDRTSYESCSDDKKANVENKVGDTPVVKIAQPESSANLCNFESICLLESSSTPEWCELWS